MKVQVISKSRFKLPNYTTLGSAGMDIRADSEYYIAIPPHQTKLIPTGLYVAIPEGYELQIRSRSGLTLQYGIIVANSPGTVDSDYRGEIGVILLNTSNDEYVITPGERIAQMILAKYERIEWEVTEKLPSTDRGIGGFGSTGK